MSSAAQTRSQLPLGQTLPLAVPAMAVRLTGAQTTPLVAVLLYGAAFVGAALLLAWGTELAQLAAEVRGAVPTDRTVVAPRA